MDFKNVPANIGMLDSKADETDLTALDARIAALESKNICDGKTLYKGEFIDQVTFESLGSCTVTRIKPVTPSPNTPIGIFVVSVYTPARNFSEYLSATISIPMQTLGINENAYAKTANVLPLLALGTSSVGTTTGVTFNATTHKIDIEINGNGNRTLENTGTIVFVAELTNA
jgi:hypothetical protein